jgi:predicted O-methyltransferase YrrM
MGTENSASLISTLIRMARPETVVEIGAGDSTILIAQALHQALIDWQRDKVLLNTQKWEERTALLDPAGIPEVYRPRLITIDDFSAEGSSAEDAWCLLRRRDIDEGIVTFVKENFYALDEATIASWGAIDIAWIDAATPADDIRFVAALWERIAPGGYLCLHEPTMLTTVNIDESQRLRRVRSPIWEELVQRLDNSFELITLPELHKYRQSGLGIVRKRQNSELKMRSNSLQSELIELGEVPIRSSYLPIGKKELDRRCHRNAITAAMDVRETRSVYAAIVLGAKSIADILEKVDIDIKVANKAVTRLLGLGLIQRNEGGLLDSDAIWRDIAGDRSCRFEDLSDRQLERGDMVGKIVDAFDFNVDYTEDEISKICQLFTVDYARLRRYLVDSGLLHRQNNIYRRAGFSKQ